MTQSIQGILYKSFSSGSMEPTAKFFGKNINTISTNKKQVHGLTPTEPMLEFKDETFSPRKQYASLSSDT